MEAFVGAIKIDLCKPYDYASHELLVAYGLQYYGIDKRSRRLLLDYFTYQKQRTKVSLSFSPFCNIDTGLPLGSVLGPPLLIFP